MTLYIFKNKPSILRIEAFRATDNSDLAKRFAKAHAKALEKIGVTKKVSSNSPSWIDDPAVIVFV